MAALHISISAEKIAQVGPLVVSNSILTSLIVTALLLAFGVAVRSQLKTTGRPTGLQNFAEFIIEALLGLIDSVTGSAKKTRQFFPVIASFFLFILLNNWLGLFPGVGTIGVIHEGESHKVSFAQQEVVVPVSQVTAATTAAPSEDHSESVAAEAVEGENHSEEGTTGVATSEEHSEEKSKGVFVPIFRAGTADLNTTIALAFISVFMTQVYGFQYLSFSYFSKFFNFSSPIAFFIGLLETVLELAKIMSFAFRLFGNIFAGEVLLAVISFLVPVIAPMPFYGLEVIVGVIQALVFTMLSVVFFNMATASHDDH